MGLSMHRDHPVRVRTVRMCRRLEILGPSPCVKCFRAPKCRLMDKSPRLLVGGGKGAIDAQPVTKAESHKGSRRRSLGLTDRLVRGRGRHTRRIVLISLRQGSLKEIYGCNAIAISRFVIVRGCSRIVRVISGMGKRLTSKGGTISVVSTMFPKKAVAKTPGMEAVRVVRRLRPIAENPCANSLN